MSDSDHDDLSWGVDSDGTRRTPMGGGADILMLPLFFLPMLLLGVGFFIYIGITDGVWDIQVAGTLGVATFIGSLVGIGVVILVLVTLFKILDAILGLLVNSGEAAYNVGKRMWGRVRG